MFEGVDDGRTMWPAYTISSPMSLKAQVSKTLRKHAYSNILEISPPNTESFQIKNPICFYISAQNIDCGYSLELLCRGASNEYPQSMFLSRNKKKIYTPVNPSFTR